MSAPAVTVIMPVHNGARFIARAIESIRQQTFSDWELIVIDDGSTDATPDILSSLHDPRIVVVRQQKSGVSVARNSGLQMASGRYVAWLDADDFYLPTALSNLSDYLEEHPEVDVVFSDGYFCDEDDRPLLRLSEHRPALYTGKILEPLVLTASVISGIICTMTRRVVLDSWQIRFDTGLAIGEDWDFWIEVARHAEFGYVDQQTCAYRIHATNSTRTSGQNKRIEDLWRARRKILEANWFQELSLATRRRFLYDVLVGLLSGRPEWQSAVLSSAPFLGLPACLRAELLRLIATDYLLRYTAISFSRACLVQAQQTWPADAKGRVILWLVRLQPLSATVVLRFWKVLRDVVVALRSVGCPGPRPVPAGLASLSD